MRIDIKKVKGKEYIQLTEGKNLFHVGSASDFDSWMIALILWKKNFHKEYIKKNEDMFNEIKKRIKKRVLLNDIDLDKIIETEKKGQYNFYNDKKSWIPHLKIYGENLEIDNAIPPLRWTLNERGELLRKRLNEIRTKQRRIKEKNHY